MNFEIHNCNRLLGAELHVAGAAVKILIAGGSSLSEDEMRRASGATYYLWKEKGAQIRSLVDELEAVQPSEG